MTFLQQKAISGALFTQVKKRGLGKKTSRPADTKKTAEIRRFPDFRFRAIDEARSYFPFRTIFICIFQLSDDFVRHPRAASFRLPLLIFLFYKGGYCRPEYRPRSWHPGSVRCKSSQAGYPAQTPRSGSPRLHPDAVLRSGQDFLPDRHP